MDDKELLTLRIYKADAVEALADNERAIKAKDERIALLEWHLEKLRSLIFHGYTQSVRWDKTFDEFYAEDGPYKTILRGEKK